MIRALAVAAAAFALGAALILDATPEAEAKGPSWIVTGGELGEQAVHVGFWRFDEEIHDPPGADAAIVDAPTEPPDDAYEFYRYATVGQVAEDVRAGDPEFRFYPGLDLLHDRREYASPLGQWYRVTDAGAVQRYVEFAVSRVGTDDLHPTPLVAAATAYGYLTRGSTSFRVVVPSWSDHSVYGTPGSLLDDDAVALGHAMVDALSIPPAGRGADPEALWLVLARHNWSGPVGFYAVPDAKTATPGRFWPQVYPTELESDAVFYTTTPVFDALVQQSIEAGAVHELERQRSAAESRARIVAANEERMARVAREQREAQQAVSLAVDPPPAELLTASSSHAAVRSTVASVAAALILAALGVVWLGRRSASR